MYLVGYIKSALRVRQTGEYRAWFDGLRDRRTRSRILARIRRLSLGNPGDVRPVGSGISELRIPHGPGYRIYFCTLGTKAVVLLAGGSKTTQRTDIARAKELAKAL